MYRRETQALRPLPTQPPQRQRHTRPKPVACWRYGTREAIETLSSSGTHGPSPQKPLVCKSEARRCRLISARRAAFSGRRPACGVAGELLAVGRQDARTLPARKRLGHKAESASRAPPAKPGHGLTGAQFIRRRRDGPSGRPAERAGAQPARRVKAAACRLWSQRGVGEMGETGEACAGRGRGGGWERGVTR